MALFKSDRPETFEVCGEPFHCTVCGNDKFTTRKAQLNTSLATMFGLDWANRSAVCVLCSQCRYIHWFLPE